jgi:hypothetical protein
MGCKNMQVAIKQHMCNQGWLSMNIIWAHLTNMLKMNDNMLFFMGKLLWLNKLQMGIL